MDIPQVFSCEYVKLHAKLNDGRRLDWSHWVPNKAVDDLFGNADPDSASYKTADEFADEQARGYMRNGIRVLWDNGSEEEIISADKIKELTTEIERVNLSVAQIFSREKHLYETPREVTVRPPRKRPSVQEIVDVLDRFLKGTATLNDFFAKVGQPPRPEPAANALLTLTGTGYAYLSNGQPVSLRPLFSDEVLFGIVEIRRQQVLQGLD
jgi:hypothetical protein